jgi:hypothetical protein
VKIRDKLDISHSAMSRMSFTGSKGSSLKYFPRIMTLAAWGMGAGFGDIQ